MIVEKSHAYEAVQKKGHEKKVDKMGKSIKETIQVAIEEVKEAIETNDSIDGDHIFSKKSKKREKKKDAMADVMGN